MIRPTLAALAVTLHENRVLLVRRRNPPDAGLWGYPGGHVEPGETALEAAARELREETSVIAEPRGYLDNIDVIRHDADGRLRHHFLLAAVLCRYVSGTPEAADDVSEASWVEFSDVFAGRLALSADVDTVLRRALERRP
ncbi:NUDIX hydrolase [Acidimangrovimonas pyrenivorans]|uniref:NUDIX hydrolase n=1 Tax=Acidimangrovimonas pyrenivorans TaxID=2030798 RepID=A0ABV7AMA5_9RHOB